MTSAWASAPCGLLLLAPDGTVREANATMLSWTGLQADDLVGRTRLPELLSVAGRIYWETHLGPLLEIEGGFAEVALELRTPTGRLPVLVSAARVEVDGEPSVSVAVTALHERRRYEQELLAARRSAEHAAARVEALQAVTAALSSAVGARAVADALLDAALAHLGADAAAIWLPDRTGALVLHRATGEGALGAERPIADAEPRVVDGRVAVALRGQSRPRGVLLLLAPTAPESEPLDLDVVTAVAAQAGLALDRAELFDESSDVAHELQQALLGGAVPTDETFAVAAYYRPGVESLEVGGDWHDVFRVPGSRRLAVSVGDVVGRGLTAATAMGQVRSAVRALAEADSGPGRVLTRLDAFVDQVDGAAMATLAYAELDLDTGIVAYACAGHLPPLLLPLHGEPELLWGGRSTPLGAFGRTSDREQAQVQLAPGDRLLLYTDGLVERRDRGLDVGLQALQHSAEAVEGIGLDAAVSTITTELLKDEGARDDVCVLLVSWSGEALERTVAADLSGLSALRAELRGWLHGRGVPEEARDDLVLAASEAVANAAEHGCGGDPALQVRLRAVVEQGAAAPRVTLSVHDDGTWREGTVSDERGRGLRIISALVDDVQLERTAGTTMVLRRSLEERSA